MAFKVLDAFDQALAQVEDAMQTKTTHTPGPWTQATNHTQYAQDPESVTIFSVSDAEIAPGRAYGDRREQMWANARLIAAAPEMLAFITDLAENWANHRGDHSVLFESCDHCRARALLGRIDGGA